MDLLRFVTKHPYLTFITFSAVLPNFHTITNRTDLEHILLYSFLDEVLFRGLLFEVLPCESLITVALGTCGSCIFAQNYSPLLWSFCIGIGRSWNCGAAF